MKVLDWWELENEYAVLNLRTGIVHIGHERTECGLSFGREQSVYDWSGGVVAIEDVCKRCIRVVEAGIRRNQEELRRSNETDNRERRRHHHH